MAKTAKVFRRKPGRPSQKTGQDHTYSFRLNSDADAEVFSWMEKWLDESDESGKRYTTRELFLRLFYGDAIERSEDKEATATRFEALLDQLVDVIERLESTGAKVTPKRAKAGGAAPNLDYMKNLKKALSGDKE